jgi:hypothetical protein
LADGLVGGGAGHNRQLERIAALVEWPAFERLLGDRAARAAVLRAAGAASYAAEEQTPA